jgi:integrase
VAWQTRAWVYYHARRLCREARVPKVSPHGIRGWLSSALTQRGVGAELIRTTLGHASTMVTARLYLSDATATGAAQRQPQVLDGDRTWD